MGITDIFMIFLRSQGKFRDNTLNYVTAAPLNIFPNSLLRHLMLKYAKILMVGY
jgi:hypothetical protein